ncbi:MAG: RnfABCDGE type electron transport complex subunit D [Gammaproteobacteria bacterium]|nr:RnfABCDGE type electron transport complex subunit D [Gammaproteobacteria bacterium]
MITSAPHAHSGLTTGTVMQRVLVAALPGIAAMVWYFGPGTLIQIALAGSAAFAAEAMVLRLRGRPPGPTLADGSALVTGVLIGIALPPLAPWWLAIAGSAFAILVAKHPYGGLGYNLFNPAMAAYAALLVSFPDAMSQWPGPRPLLSDGTLPGLVDSLQRIFTGQHAAPDGFTMATPLDLFRHNSGLMVQQFQTAHPLFARGDLAGVGWETVNLGFLAGGVYLLARRVITWHAPVAMLAALVLMALLCNDGGSSASRGPPSLHLFSGATMLGAFFIVTDPVTTAASNRGRLLCGLLTGVLVFAIRAWGGYSDGVAFAVLLMNLAAPLIDRITVPRAYGHGRARQHHGAPPE